MAKEFYFTIENPEWARWTYLALSGNQSEHRIRFILPVHRGCHINIRTVKEQPGLYLCKTLRL